MALHANLVLLRVLRAFRIQVVSLEHVAQKVLPVQVIGQSGLCCACRLLSGSPTTIDKITTPENRCFFICRPRFYFFCSFLNFLNALDLSIAPTAPALPSLTARPYGLSV